MSIFLIISFFVLGAIIGSFLNVVIYRHNTGIGIGGRSFCNTCGKNLKWFELVPILSFLVQVGRCRGCDSKISIQYVSVEIMAGFIFSLIYLNLAESFLIEPVITGARFLVLAGIFSILMIIFVYDLKHTIIPDVFSYSFAGLSLLFVISESLAGINTITTSHVLAGPILFLPFWALWFFSGGKWMGLGDGKLAWGIGWLLGLSAGFTAVMIGFWIGAFASLALILISNFSANRGGFTMKSEIPFAPFLILGLFLTFFTGIDLVSLIVI